MENIKSLTGQLKKDAKILGQHEELSGIGGDCARAARALNELQAERDAAVDDLHNIITLISRAASGCYLCKHIARSSEDEPCKNCTHGDNKWEWQGTQNRGDQA